MKFVNINNKVLILICMLLILTLSACKQIEQPNEEINLENEQQEISYFFNNPNTGQEFNIIHAYLLYENYFEALQENPDELSHQLYQQEVIKPVYEACFEDAEYLNIHSEDIFEWIPKNSELDRIENQIDSINKDHLNELFEESLVKSSDILPSDKKTNVCIFPKSERSPYDMVTIGSGKIAVFHSRPDHTYKSGMSHEYHHSVLIGKQDTENNSETGLDRIIMEGKAVMFETMVYPHLNSSHYVVDENFDKEYWSKIEPYLKSLLTPAIHDEMIIGGTNGLPYAYGYSEGFKMVRTYLDLHPDMTVEEWTTKSSKEIFEEGNYIGNYQ